jgi:site-specific recombinase XerC
MGAKSKVYGILSSILHENAITRTNGRVASHRTATAYGEVLNKCFDDLNELGYKLQNPRNLNETHVRALCESWHAAGKQVSTMQEYLSKLRVFAGWIGKKGMVKSLPTYLPQVDKNELKVRKAALTSKSWSEKGVNIIEKIQQADAIDWRFGLMIRMMLAFGLRRKEVTHNKPWKADHGDKLVIYLGEAKGGRPRDIHFDNDEQRQVLDFVKTKVGKNEYLGWDTTIRGKKASFKYCLRRYNDSMEKIGITKLKDGVTGHGLRAQYAENAALIAGMIPPTLGGTGGQMPRDELNVKRAQISENLGHSRTEVTVSYYGSFGRDVGQDNADRCQKNISNALRYLDATALPRVPAERLPDCLQLIGEMALIDVSMSPSQAQALWTLHSQRFASDWVKPRQGNAEAIEATANGFVKQFQTTNQPA